ncbi:hypothetical protein AVEN_172207-1, partial [Araneus ventricosus]
MFAKVRMVPGSRPSSPLCALAWCLLNLRLRVKRKIGENDVDS